MVVEDCLISLAENDLITYLLKVLLRKIVILEVAAVASVRKNDDEC